MSSLSKQFDGFYIDYCCRFVVGRLAIDEPEMYTEEDYEKDRVRVNALSLFIKRCYVLVISPYDEYKNRFWILWECLQAMKN